MLRRAVLLVVMLLAAVPLVAPSSAFAAPTCFGQPATHVMKIGDSSYSGTAGNDVVVGSNGVDWVDLRFTNSGGIDLVCGGGGDDTIYLAGAGSKADGGPGNDYLYGVHSAQLFGGAGNDTVEARCCKLNPTDAPTLGVGGSGDDYLTADFEAVIKGGSGNDYLECNNRPRDNAFCVALEGGSGNDTLRNVDSGPTLLLDCGSGRRDKVLATGAITVRNCEGTTS